MWKSHLSGLSLNGGINPGHSVCAFLSVPAKKKKSPESSRNIKEFAAKCSVGGQQHPV